MSSKSWVPWIVAAVVGCVIMAVLLPLVGSYMFLRGLTMPRGYLVHAAEWPQPFYDMFGTDEVQIFGLAQFLDERVIAEIAGHDERIEEVIQTYDLLPTDASHPEALKLKQSMPSDWKKWQDHEDDRWYTSKDFGSVHLEGQDLFLLVTNAKTRRTVIYYNWIF